MNWKVRMALSALLAVMPRRAVDARKLDKVLEKLDLIRQTVDQSQSKDYTIDVRDLIGAIIEGV